MLGGQLPEVSQVPDTASLTYALLLWVLSKFEESKLCWHGGYGCSGIAAGPYWILTLGIFQKGKSNINYRHQLLSLY
jgi:ABC-type thiamine transport system substrate-binding protein